MGLKGNDPDRITAEIRPCGEGEDPLPFVSEGKGCPWRGRFDEGKDRGILCRNESQGSSSSLDEEGGNLGDRRREPDERIPNDPLCAVGGIKDEGKTQVPCGEGCGTGGRWRGWRVIRGFGG
jgi:hypothetical protein